MRVFLLLVCCLAIRCSAEKSECAIVIRNETNSELDSVLVVLDTTRLTFTGMKPKDLLTQAFSTSHLKKEHRDNTFSLAVYVKDSLVRTGTFGYFTHGEIKEKYTITIFDNFQYREE